MSNIRNDVGYQFSFHFKGPAVKNRSKTSDVGPETFLPSVDYNVGDDVIKEEGQNAEALVPDTSVGNTSGSQNEYGRRGPHTDGSVTTNGRWGNLPGAPNGRGGNIPLTTNGRGGNIPLTTNGRGGNIPETTNGRGGNTHITADGENDYVPYNDEVRPPAYWPSSPYYRPMLPYLYPYRHAGSTHLPG